MSRYRPGHTVPRRRSFGWLLFVIPALALIGAIVLWVGAYKASQRDVTFRVEDKERVCKSGDGGCEYLVFTDQGTFAIKDSFLIWRFDSSDVYGRIKDGQSYEAEVIGWRIPFLSMYPNIVEARG